MPLPKGKLSLDAALSRDALFHVDTFLGARDALRLSLTSKELQHLVAQSPHWKRRCASDFLFTDAESWRLDRNDHKTLYLYLLKYRTVIGLFGSETVPRGGLLISVIGERCFVTKLVFCNGLPIDPESHSSGVLPNEYVRFTSYEIFEVEGDTPGTSTLRVRMRASRLHNMLKIETHAEGFIVHNSLSARITRFVCLQKLQGPRTFDSPMSGLYAGHYFVHGWELLKVTVEPPLPADRYHMHDKVIFAQKVSGDPNIPVGKVSFQAHFPEEKLFEEIYKDQKHVASKFDGCGQVAHHNYTAPAWIAGHMKYHVESGILDLVWDAFSTISLYRIDRHPAIEAAMKYDFTACCK